MFCKYCGKEIDNGSTFCPYCGGNVASEESSNDYDLNNRVDQDYNQNYNQDYNQNYNQNNEWNSSNYQYNNYQPQVSNEVGVGWVILSFLIPIAGLICYFYFKNTKPRQAEYCGIAAAISFGINLISLIL